MIGAMNTLCVWGGGGYWVRAVGLGREGVREENRNVTMVRRSNEHTVCVWGGGGYWVSCWIRLGKVREENRNVTTIGAMNTLCVCGGGGGGGVTGYSALANCLTTIRLSDMNIIINSSLHFH